MRQFGKKKGRYEYVLGEMHKRIGNVALFQRLDHFLAPLPICPIRL